MTTTIKAVVFDLGGVLIDWDPRYVYRELLDSEEEVTRFLDEICTDEWNVQQDAGRPMAEATEWLVARHPEHEDLIRTFYDRWADMLGGPLPDTVEVLRELKATDVQLFCLTNWSAETFPVALKLFDFLHWFEDIVVSGTEKLIKPDRRIYEVMIERSGLAANELFFIDDKKYNVEAAWGAGMQAVQFTGADKLREDLRGLGLLAA